MQRGLLWEGTLTLSPPHLPMAGACGTGCAGGTGLGDAHAEPMKSLQGCGQSLPAERRPSLLCSTSGISAALFQLCRELHGVSAEQDAPETTASSES